MLRKSPWLGTKPGFFSWGPGGFQAMPRIPNEGSLTCPVSRRGTNRSPDSRKEYRGPMRNSTRRTPRHFHGQNTAGQGGRAEAEGSLETIRPGKESKVEGTIGPGLSGTSTTLPQRKECPQCHSHPKTMSLLTRHRVTPGNLPGPEDHQAPHLQATLQGAYPGDWPGHGQISGTRGQPWEPYKNTLRLTSQCYLRTLTCLPSISRG